MLRYLLERQSKRHRSGRSYCQRVRPLRVRRWPMDPKILQSGSHIKHFASAARLPVSKEAIMTALEDRIVRTLRTSGNRVRTSTLVYRVRPDNASFQATYDTIKAMEAKDIVWAAGPFHVLNPRHRQASEDA